MNKLDCSCLLESKLVHFVSYEDLSYFMQSSDSNVPQRITPKFTEAFNILLDRAIQNDKKEEIIHLLLVIEYLMKQGHTGSMQVLMSTGFQNVFEKIIIQLRGQWSSKKVARPEADEVLSRMVNILTDFVKLKGDKYNWFINTMLFPLLEIVGNPTAYYKVRVCCVDALLSICTSVPQEIIAALRQYVCTTNPNVSPLCCHMMQNLSQIGDYHLQELIIEFMFRIWSTDKRKTKALLWCNNNKELARKLLMITYDQFDNGVRVFLNALNSTSMKRRVVTLPYKELQFGSQKVTPLSQGNWVDLCYESKALLLNIPAGDEEDEDFYCPAPIDKDQVCSFDLFDNGQLNTIDLNINLNQLASEVLSDLPIKEEMASNIVIRFKKTMIEGKQIVNKNNLTHFITVLFGQKLTGESSQTMKMSKSTNRLERRIQRYPDSQSSQGMQASQREHIFNASFVDMSPSAFSQESSHSMMISKSTNRLERRIQPSSQPPNSMVRKGDDQRVKLNSRTEARMSNRTSKPTVSRISDGNVSSSSQSQYGSQKISHSGFIPARPSASNHLPSMAEAVSKPPKIDSRSHATGPRANPDLPSGSVMNQPRLSRNITNHAVQSRPSSSNISSRRYSANSAVHSKAESPENTSLFSGLFSDSAAHLPPDIIYRPPSKTKLKQAESPKVAPSEVASHASTSKMPNHASQKISGHASQKMPSHVASSKVPTQAKINLPVLSRDLTEVMSDLSSHDITNVPNHATSSRASQKSKVNRSKPKKYESEPGNTKSHPLMKIIGKMKLKSSKKSEKQEPPTTDSSDAFQEKSRYGKVKKPKPEPKSLKEMMKDANNNTEWNDIVPETQVGTSFEESRADMSTDLMLSQIMQPAEPDKPIETSVKSRGKGKLLSVEIPRRITRSSQRVAEDERNDREASYSPEYPSNPRSATIQEDKMVTEKLSPVVPVLGGDGEKDEEVKDTEPDKQPPSGEDEKTSTMAEKVNQEFQPLEDLSMNGMVLCSDYESDVKTRKLRPYVAKFIKNNDNKDTKSETTDSSNGKRKRKTTKQRKVTVEVIKTESESRTTETESKSAKESSTETDQRRGKREKIPGSMKAFLKKTKEMGDKMRQEKQKSMRMRRASALNAMKVTTSESDDVFEIEKIRDAPAMEETINLRDDDDEPILFKDSEPEAEVTEGATTTITEGTSDTVTRAWSVKKPRSAGFMNVSSGEQYIPSEMSSAKSSSSKSRPTEKVKAVATKIKKKQTKKPRVSFDDYDFNLHENEEKQKKRQENKEPRVKKVRRSRIFDSSSAGSGSSSELSWIVDHEKKQNLESTRLKPFMTYSNRHRMISGSINLSPLKLNPDVGKILEEDLPSPEKARSEPLRTQVKRNVPQMMSLVEACDMSFDDIVRAKDVDETSDNEKLTSNNSTSENEEPNVSLPPNLNGFSHMQTKMFGGHSTLAQNEVHTRTSPRAKERRTEEKEPKSSLPINDDFCETEEPNVSIPLPSLTGFSHMQTKMYETLAQNEDTNTNTRPKERRIEEKEPRSSLPINDDFWETEEPNVSIPLPSLTGFSHMQTKMYETLDQNEVTKANRRAKEKTRTDIQDKGPSFSKISPETRTTNFERAQMNNQTPASPKQVPLVEKPRKRQKRKAEKRKIVEDFYSSSSSPHTSALRYKGSKKMLNMNRGGESSSSAYEDDVQLPARKVLKLMAKYRQDIQQVWKQSTHKRTRDMRNFRREVAVHDKNHYDFMLNIRQTESKFARLINGLKLEVNDLMKGAASNLVAARSLRVELERNLDETTQATDKAMKKIHQKISKELKEKVEMADLAMGLPRRTK